MSARRHSMAKPIKFQNDYDLEQAIEKQSYGQSQGASSGLITSSGRPTRTTSDEYVLAYGYVDKLVHIFKSKYLKFKNGSPHYNAARIVVVKRGSQERLASYAEIVLGVSSGKIPDHIYLSDDDDDSGDDKEFKLKKQISSSEDDENESDEQEANKNGHLKRLCESLSSNSIAEGTPKRKPSKFPNLCLNVSSSTVASLSYSPYEDDTVKSKIFNYSSTQSKKSLDSDLFKQKKIVQFSPVKLRSQQLSSKSPSLQQSP
jgi:hypothetical protein